MALHSRWIEQYNKHDIGPYQNVNATDVCFEQTLRQKVTSVQSECIEGFLYTCLMFNIETQLSAGCSLSVYALC